MQSCCRLLVRPCFSKAKETERETCGKHGPLKSALKVCRNTFQTYKRGDNNTVRELPGQRAEFCTDSSNTLNKQINVCSKIFYQGFNDIPEKNSLGECISTSGSKRVRI